MPRSNRTGEIFGYREGGMFSEHAGKPGRAEDLGEKASMLFRGMLEGTIPTASAQKK